MRPPPTHLHHLRLHLQALLLLLLLLSCPQPHCAAAAGLQLLALLPPSLLWLLQGQQTLGWCQQPLPHLQPQV
jgi:hypothetical protein